ncbi:hypothetical protein Ahy_A09g042631 isoform B [Arachis hypogaea]|uniref:Uncharacterized protein n=1 Tax=Arachis hypogaea TaxID=3818 RepID=A0A445BGJ6_ARAHY|nr:hypothetical protein Ahy_A09g042631 isoform B [Arachis hypogaea]
MEKLSKGVEIVATIVLEVVASSHLWIWHAFFGVFGSNNDTNVLDRSHVFDNILNDPSPEVNYTINGNNYTMEKMQVICTIPRRAKKRRRASIQCVASTLCNYIWSSTLFGKKKETCKHDASLYYIS